MELELTTRASDSKKGPASNTTGNDVERGFEPAFTESGTHDDEIDLFALLGFMWSVRVYAVMGLALGALVGSYFALSRATGYVTKISVSLDGGSLPAVTDPKLVVDNFTSALNSPELVQAAFDALIKAAPGLPASLEAQKIEVSNLVSRQVLADKPALIPLRIKQSLSNSDFTLEALLPVKGLGAEAAKALVAAFNASASMANSKAISMKTDTTKILVSEATQASSEADSNYGSLRIAHESELAKVRNELAQLEYRLYKYARTSGLDVSQFVTRMSSAATHIYNMSNFSTKDADGSVRTADADDDASLSTDRLVRLTAALTEERKIKVSEADEIHAKIAALKARFEKSKAIYSSVRQASKATLDKLFVSMQKAAVPIDRTSLFLPLFKVNEGMFETSLQNKSVEVPSSSNLSLILLGAVSGSILAIIARGLAVFIKRNKARIMSLSGG